MQLVKVTPSTRKHKKLAAQFSDGTVTHFGDSRYSDYTKNKDESRRKNYRKRHFSGAKAPPKTANSLSYHLLWGESTSLQKNIETYRKKFSL